MEFNTKSIQSCHCPPPILALEAQTSPEAATVSYKTLTNTCHSFQSVHKVLSFMWTVHFLCHFLHVNLLSQSIVGNVAAFQLPRNVYTGARNSVRILL